MKRRSSWIWIELTIWWSTDSICLSNPDINLSVPEKDSRFIEMTGVDSMSVGMDARFGWIGITMFGSQIQTDCVHCTTALQSVTTQQKGFHDKQSHCLLFAIHPKKVFCGVIVNQWSHHCPTMHATDCKGGDRLKDDG